jgi:hypothetical protein
MTRQRSLKRRIRARMARTGERYATARRQVLRRLGNGARPVADQPEAAEARRRHRKRIGAVGLVVAVTVVGAVIVVATQRSEGPTDQGPSTASTSEDRHPVGGPTDQCRRVGDALAQGVPLRDLQAFEGAGATPRDFIECMRLVRTHFRELGPHEARILRLLGSEGREAMRSSLVMRAPPPLSRRGSG